MVDKVFEKGWLVEVTTWENDLDNYRTGSYHFTNLGEAMLVAMACEQFRSIHREGQSSPLLCLGNEDIIDWEFETVLLYVGQKYDFSEDVIESIDLDIFFDLVGVWDYGHRYRVVESVYLYEIPETVVFEEFIVKSVDEEFNYE